MNATISTSLMKVSSIRSVAVKSFSLAEANALIPRLEMLMQQMQRAALILRSAVQDEIDGDTPPPRTTADILRNRPDLAEHARDLERGVAEIERLGCQFKGLDLGLVDFPTQIDGSTALLCWQYGEKEVAYWHRPDEGFAGRRPLGSVTAPPLQ
jgi:hypothetical protein